MAAVLLIAGISMLVIAARAVTRAYNNDQLVTSGILALVRNPIYSAWLVFIIPGLALLGRSWPLLLTPVIGYAVFKRLIHREDEYLRQRFGKTYLDYRAQVSELIPIPRGKAPMRTDLVVQESKLIPPSSWQIPPPISFFFASSGFSRRITVVRRLPAAIAEQQASYQAAYNQSLPRKSCHHLCNLGLGRCSGLGMRTHLTIYCV